MVTCRKLIFTLSVILYLFSCNKKESNKDAGPDYTSAMGSARAFHGIETFNTLNTYDSVIASVKDSIADTLGTTTVLSHTSINLFGLNFIYGSSDSATQCIIFVANTLTGNPMFGFVTGQLSYYYAKDSMVFYMSQLQGTSGTILSLVN